ncbi:MAG TPA: SBBP repeat-containing protein, partial [Candidatus Binataceae bacterium]|nr:SBBP repeat-containing protein [Candidatus Binataceae bacterium]
MLPVTYADLPRHGSGSEEGLRIAVDSSLSAYVTGYTLSSDFPTTPGAFQTTYNGNGKPNAYVSKLSFDGLALTLTYSTFLGGSGGDNGFAIALDTSGDAYVAGYTRSIDFPVSGNALQPTLSSPVNAFMT